MSTLEQEGRMELIVGQSYQINYVDKSYPCDCECHTDKNILHFMPCCSDMSYKGPGKFVAFDQDRELYVFEVGSRVIGMLAENISELETRINFKCLDCQEDTNKINEYYMVKDEVWLKANPKNKGMLCIGCLEERLGRELEYKDFSDANLNLMSMNFRFPKSDRLICRLVRNKLVGGLSGHQRH